MFENGSPFLLFDDARAGGEGCGRLYRKPLRIIETRRPEDIESALQQLREAERSGAHIAGFLSYEAGYAMEPKLAPLCASPTEDAPPLLWFGLFDHYENLLPGDVEKLLPDGDGAWSSPAEPVIDRTSYEAMVVQIKNHIAAGNIYQANLTFPAQVHVAGHPLALYASIRNRAKAGHGGIAFTGKHWLLSFSPELFFTQGSGRIVTRPMKGTAKRHANEQTDAAMAASLKNDPKQRAENLMIVDLLRNDLARVSKPGSVKVPSLFEIETYPTVHQMTSTVMACLQDGKDAIDVIKTIFPCGSITGAPKIRAMEIIADVEQFPRNAYTGSIGWISPGGQSTFNVAIRTLIIAAGAQKAALGLGSAIVADSQATEEWEECLAKGAFVASGRQFDLVETMRFEPSEGIIELERHLARLQRSALQFKFPFSWHSIRNDLQAVAFHSRGPRLIRLRLSRSGAIAIEGRPLPAPLTKPVKVALKPLPVASSDFRLCHKTSDRAFYEKARKDAGTFEILFTDEGGFLTEGSFTNIFVERGGRLLTPPVSRGLLPGILREKLIAEGRTEEADLTPADLADGFYIGNIVRGLMPATL